jgi:hypothetical protein
LKVAIFDIGNAFLLKICPCVSTAHSLRRNRDAAQVVGQTAELSGAGDIRANSNACGFEMLGQLDDGARPVVQTLIDQVCNDLAGGHIALFGHGDLSAGRCLAMIHCGLSVQVVAGCDLD